VPMTPVALAGVYLLSTPAELGPNAGPQAPPMAEATQERRLLAVACKPSLGQGSCRDAASGFFSSPVSWQPTPTPFVHYCLSDDFFSVAVLLDGRKSGRKTPLG
jgi:hypothetical protein